jgi:hypothetical protein
MRGGFLARSDPGDRYDRLFVMEAMMQMVKLDIGKLHHAYQGAA